MKSLRLALALGTLSTLLACSPKDPAPTSNSGNPSPVVAEASAPVAAAPVNEAGKKIYGATCSMCHAAGVGGAPKPGDKADWAPRIAQGYETLVKHAIEGIRNMPARGGNPDLTDNEIASAVAVMTNDAGASFDPATLKK